MKLTYTFGYHGYNESIRNFEYDADKEDLTYALADILAKKVLVGGKDFMTTAEYQILAKAREFYYGLIGEDDELLDNLAKENELELYKWFEDEAYDWYIRTRENGYGL